jgi:hypothetical protein
MRVLAAVAAGLCVLAWLAAVVVWTTAGRVTTDTGFADVTIETVQSPPGAQAVTDALAQVVDEYATARGVSLTPSSREIVRAQVEDVILGADLPGLLGPAVQQARRAFEANPSGPVTIDFSALRPIAEERVRQVNPALVSAIPPDEDLVVTVQPRDLPSAAGTIAGAADMLRWLPLWLLLGAVALGAVGLWASGSRSRMLRAVGAAVVVTALLPLAMRLAVPPVAASFVEAGNPGEVVSTATVAILGRWWIALVACLGVGGGLFALGVRVARRRPVRRSPIVLGR